MGVDTDDEESSGEEEGGPALPNPEPSARPLLSRLGSGVRRQAGHMRSSLCSSVSRAARSVNSMRGSAGQVPLPLAIGAGLLMGAVMLVARRKPAQQQVRHLVGLLFWRGGVRRAQTQMYAWAGAKQV